MNQIELTPIEHIRKRPGMYVGEMSIYGFQTILSYLFEDFEKEIKSKTEIKFELNSDNCIKIEIENIETLVFIDTINNLNQFKESHCFSLPVLIGLSEEIKIRIENNQNVTILNSKNGIYNVHSEPVFKKIKKIEIEFSLDKILFKNLKISYELLNLFIRKYAYLNTNIKIISKYISTSNNQINIFNYPKGLEEILEIKIAEIALKTPDFKINVKTKVNEYEFDICFTYQYNWLNRNFISTFANQNELIFGGSLENGILDGIILALKNNAKEKNENIEINYKTAKQELFLIAKVKGNDFTFGGATKSKLEMPKMRKQIKDFVFKEVAFFLKENPNINSQLMERFRMYK